MWLDDDPLKNIFKTVECRIYCYNEINPSCQFDVLPIKQPDLAFRIPRFSPIVSPMHITCGTNAELTIDNLQCFLPFRPLGMANFLCHICYTVVW